MRNYILFTCSCFSLILLFISCRGKDKIDAQTIGLLDLKRGNIVSCGPMNDDMFGSVSFTSSVPTALKKNFNTAIALLHSFEYDESEKMFAKIIDQAPNCAMAYWGVAMCNFHPLWELPSSYQLQKGEKAVEIARSIKNKAKREEDYIKAIGLFYDKSDQLDHRSRVLNFKKGMEEIYKDYPDDKEAAVFYALALNAAADPRDKTYAFQKEAFNILNKLFEQEPQHPGIAHYIIHNFDYPGLAQMALPAARKYASIAPASAHAQHMPSHIFTRLGLWDECIKSNLVSISSAKCYAEQAGIRGHWDEELHGMDYLVYAYLQENKVELAKQQVDYLYTFSEVYPVNFKDAYAFAAIPARYALERKDWKMAAALRLYPSDFPWEKFPWQEAIIHFARAIGQIHMNELTSASNELDTLNLIYEKLNKNPNKAIEAAHVMVQIRTAEAWLLFKKGNDVKALELMRSAAEMEDSMEKHPVTPGAVIPARELLGEMLLAMNKPSLALEAFEMNLKQHPNRRNGLAGAKMATQLIAGKGKIK